MATTLLLALAVRSVAGLGLQGHRWPPNHQLHGTPPKCQGGTCAAFAHYPVNETRHHAVFNVPALPLKTGPTFFVYYNIDWQAAGPKGSDARMNQFVPQLMLGNPLCNSTGPPLYKPIWHKFDTWVFGAQYFFEIFNKTANKTQAHAATGELFPTREGEVIYTSFDLDKSTWSWSLTMGVRGDATRVSTLVVPAPFMGLIKEETSSWSEPVYAKAVSNACWELYGIAGAENYPRSNMTIVMQADLAHEDEAFDWSTRWRFNNMTCEGHPSHESHTSFSQSVQWDLFRS